MAWPRGRPLKFYYMYIPNKLLKSSYGMSKIRSLEKCGVWIGLAYTIREINFQTALGTRKKLKVA